MSTITYSGIVLNITQCCGNGTYGTDFNGYFGPAGTSIIGLPYSITWTGEGNAVLGASITINDHTFAFGAADPARSSFTDAFWPAFDQIQYIANGQLFSMTTNSIEGKGVFYIPGNSFNTQAFLQVPTPGPVIGSGIETMLATTILIVAWLAQQFRHGRQY
jgi:hypothetical protein